MILCILKGNSPIKMHKIIFFPEKKCLKKCEPTPPKIFRRVTRSTLIFLFGLFMLNMVIEYGIFFQVYHLTSGLM